MPMKSKYERRLVARNSLTELERDVADLESEGWELDPTVPDENSGTVLGIMRKMRVEPQGVSIIIPMRRQIRTPSQIDL